MFNAAAHKAAGASRNLGISPLRLWARPQANTATARALGQKPFASAWEHVASGVSLGSHDASDSAAETSSGKPLEGFGGQGWLLLPQSCWFLSKIQTQPSAFHILEKLKPH